jgi:hypothetical protein
MVWDGKKAEASHAVVVTPCGASLHRLLSHAVLLSLILLRPLAILLSLTPFVRALIWRGCLSRSSGRLLGHFCLLRIPAEDPAM